MLRKLLIVTTSIIILVAFLMSATAYAKPQKRKLLSSVGSLGPGDIAISQPFDGEIIGGVSLNKNECSYTVQNTSEESTMRFSVVLEETNANGKSRSVTSGTYKLKPGQSDKRSARVRAKTIGCALWITRWKEDKKKKDEEKEEEEENGKETANSNKSGKTRSTYKRDPSTLTPRKPKATPSSSKSDLGIKFNFEKEEKKQKKNKPIPQPMGM